MLASEWKSESAMPLDSALESETAKVSDSDSALGTDLGLEKG